MPVLEGSWSSREKFLYPAMHPIAPIVPSQLRPTGLVLSACGDYKLAPFSLLQDKDMHLIAPLFCPSNLTKILVVGLLVALGLVCLPTAAQQVKTPTAQQGRQVTLSDQLTLGLRARTKGDAAFIAKVVVLVEQGKLPRSVVDSTFHWARQRAAQHSHSRRLRPIVYFQPGLRQRVQRFGIKL